MRFIVSLAVYSGLVDAAGFEESLGPVARSGEIEGKILKDGRKEYIFWDIKSVSRHCGYVDERASAVRSEYDEDSGVFSVDCNVGGLTFAFQSESTIQESGILPLLQANLPCFCQSLFSQGYERIAVDQEKINMSFTTGEKGDVVIDCGDGVSIEKSLKDLSDNQVVTVKGSGLGAGMVGYIKQKTGVSERKYFKDSDKHKFHKGLAAKICGREIIERAMAKNR